MGVVAVGRPRSVGSRGLVVKFRVSGEEKAVLEAAAGAAGLSLSDYLRGAALSGSADVAVPVVSARVRTDSRTVPVEPLPVAPREIAAAGFRCPFGPGRCSFVAPSSRARCPVHGRTVVAR